MTTAISLGRDCIPSILLDRLGMREAAYPFDWLFSSLEMVEHCLVDDFRTFLDPNQHEPVGPRRSEHRFYRERFGVNRVFNHHAMPENIPHFERAIERFKSAPDPVFVHIDRTRSPDRDCLGRLRSRLPGPILVYLIAPKGDRVEAPAGVEIVRLPGPWNLDLFADQAVEIGFADRLAADIARTLRPVPPSRGLEPADPTPAFRTASSSPNSR